YVTTNPSTITAVLDNATGKFNWCVYGSDFPPNAKNNSSGGYDLRGSPPFIINNTIEWKASTYSGSEITALTDATGCPGVWCGKNGEAAGVLNCCVTGTTNCNGTCKTTGTYTTNDGACAGACNRAYVQLRNQCGEVTNSTYGTYTNSGCTTPNYTTNDGACTGDCNKAYTQQRNACGTVINAKFSTYTNTSCTTPNYTTNDGACTRQCDEAYTQLHDACGNIINEEYGVYYNPQCTAGCRCDFHYTCKDVLKPSVESFAECNELCLRLRYPRFNWIRNEDNVKLDCYCCN
ncbi:MAG: hypothetical protein LBD87_07630, partial [Prevotellaceae bacterium]|nr:hypothetical protein [Prevotellaceae bacterium]